MLLCWCCISAPDAKAQANAWIVGTEWARLNNADAAPTFTDLPAHVGTPNTYQGNSPQFSSAIQLDDRGLPLFFIVDGDVFDGEGFLIAPRHVTTWNEGLVRDNGLLFQGTGEVVVFPVPGRCGKWYVFHSRSPLSSGYSYQELSFAVLDMAVQNELYPGDDTRRGRLYDIEDLYEQGFEPMINPAEGRFSLTYNEEIPHTPGFGVFPNGQLHFEALHNESTGRSFLFAHNAFHLARFEILSDRIVPLGAIAIPAPPGTQPKLLRTKGEIEAVSLGSDVKVALVFNALEAISK